MLERLQRVSFWVAVISAGLGLVTSSGCGFVSEIPAGSLWFLHPLLFGLGGAAMLLWNRRAGEIDRERWQVVEEAGLTSGEREYAHQRAERERRWSALAFGSSPLMLGYWLAHQVAPGDRPLLSDLLPASALLGSLLAFVALAVSGRRGSRES